MQAFNQQSRIFKSRCQIGDAGMLVFMQDDTALALSTADAEVLLNDGILNRLKIRIELSLCSSKQHSASVAETGP